MRWTVAIFSAVILGMSMLAVVDAQSPGDQKPQTLLLQAQPSALPSPVAVNEYDSPRTDGEGNIWTRVRGTITSTISNLLTTDLDSNGSTNVTTGAGVALLVPGAGGPATVPGDATNGLYVQLREGGLANSDGLQVQGRTAHDGVIGTERPILAGGYAHATGSLPSTVSANGDAARLLVDRYGRARVALESPTGTAWGDTDGLWVQQVDVGNSALGHLVAYETQCAGGTAESTAKAGAGLLKWVHVSNPNTTDCFLQIFAASNPTPGSTTPTMSFCVPGGSGASNRGVYNQEFGSVGISLSTAITYTITTTANGGTAPAANCTVGIGYK